MAKTTKVRKIMTFPKQMVDILETKAERLGYDFNDYVYFKLAQEAENELDMNMPVYQATPEEEEAIGEGLKDYYAGRYTEVNSAEELKKHLASL